MVLIFTTSAPLRQDALYIPPHSTVEVIKSEEKGSNVNLAVKLANDSWLELVKIKVELAPRQSLTALHKRLS